MESISLSLPLEWLEDTMKALETVQTIQLISKTIENGKLNLMLITDNHFSLVELGIMIATNIHCKQLESFNKILTDATKKTENE